MSDDSGRKKTVLVSLLAFLLIGGGVFLFFILQGGQDLKKDRNAGISFNSVMRNSVLPFFNRSEVEGLSDKELALVGQKMDEMRVEGAQDGSGELDMTDWMAADNPDSGAFAAASARPGGGAYASGRAPSAIPRMEGGRGGFSAGGGGQSNSSGGADRFARGSDKRSTKISAPEASTGQGAAPGQGGSLGSLRSARAMLSGGLRSGSAMTAKSSWDKSFGAGTTERARGGSAAGNMTYEKKGLVGLDAIKTGDIRDLKASDPSGAPSTPEASMPALVEDKKEPANALADAGKDMVNSMLPQGSWQLFGAQGSSDSGASGSGKDNSGTVKPPDEIKKVAENEKTYWPEGRSNTFVVPVSFFSPPIPITITSKDDSISYKKEGDVWTAEIKGNVTVKMGYNDAQQAPKEIPYTYTYEVRPGQDPPLLAKSCVPGGLCRKP